MKSEKANEFIKKPDFYGNKVDYFRDFEVIHAVELSENEMQEKAIEAFNVNCYYYQSGNCVTPEKYVGICSNIDCYKRRNFINNLNNK